jgi:hypothetical protein
MVIHLWQKATQMEGIRMRQIPLDILKSRMQKLGLSFILGNNNPELTPK